MCVYIQWVPVLIDMETHTTEILDFVTHAKRSQLSFRRSHTREKQCTQLSFLSKSKICEFKKKKRILQSYPSIWNVLFHTLQKISPKMFPISANPPVWLEAKSLWRWFRVLRTAVLRLVPVEDLGFAGTGLGSKSCQNNCPCVHSEQINKIPLNRHVSGICISMFVLLIGNDKEIKTFSTFSCLILKKASGCISHLVQHEQCV